MAAALYVAPFPRCRPSPAFGSQTPSLFFVPGGEGRWSPSWAVSWERGMGDETVSLPASLWCLHDGGELVQV